MKYIKQIISEYKRGIEPLLVYVPWLTQNVGKQAKSIYEGEGIKGNTIPIPVFDGTLMNFIKETQKTGWMDRNYVYVYSKNHVRDIDDERRLIAKATVHDFKNLTGILSKYVMGGMTKSYLWSQGVEEGIFLLIIEKMREIIEFWDKPLS